MTDAANELEAILASLPEGATLQDMYEAVVGSFAPDFNALLQNQAKLELQADAARCERSLAHYLRAAWPNFDPSEHVSGWHLDAIAEHLEAVSRGEIRRLLINIPPRFGKTNLVSIAWPTWTWIQAPDAEYPLMGPGVRFLCASYGANKAQQDGVTARRLIGSKWYQERWGKRVEIEKSRDNQEQYDTRAGGYRICTGIPESLGKGGVIRILDDPHKTDEVESEAVLASQIRSYNEVWRTRSNDPSSGAEVIIMQRLGEGDLSGYLLSHDEGAESEAIVHLKLPLEFEPADRCVTVRGGQWIAADRVTELGPARIEDWADPREEDGELLWPERFDEAWCRNQRESIGSYAYAGQYLQRPEPRGGGIIKNWWWKDWPPEGERKIWTNEKGEVLFPPFDFNLLYLDTAFTEKDENARCACIRWGTFRDSAGRPRVMLAGAWEDRPTLRELSRMVLDSCRKWNADILVIENRAGAEWVRQELQRLMHGGEFQIALDEPFKDKTARLHSVSVMFEEGMIFAPDKQWAANVIDQVSKFPRGKWRDLVDCTSGGLGYLRRNGYLRLPDEFDEDERESLVFKGLSESGGGSIVEAYEV